MKKQNKAALVRIGGNKGAAAQHASMTPEQRSAHASQMARTRWGYVVEGGKRVYKTSEETRRRRAKANERMPWPEPEPCALRSSSPINGLGSGGDRAKWTQPKQAK